MTNKEKRRRKRELTFLPTPPEIINRMLDAADIKPGMLILEPSAGRGDIADAIRARGIEPDVMEIDEEKRRILAEKGYQVVAEDFLTDGGKYDRIVMVPPFAGHEEIIHVFHAYWRLHDNGRLVSLVSNGRFTQKEWFNRWFRAVGGRSEEMPAEPYKSKIHPGGLITRMVVIDK